tara:strand:+ start:507 stop:788 length:282 start_codon:yes stop_codon:yes gene_type:complete
MKTIHELKDLNKNTIKGSHISVHLAALYEGLDPQEVSGKYIYDEFAKNNPQAKARFKQTPFHGASSKLKDDKKKKITRYDGEWITNIIKSIYK